MISGGGGDVGMGPEVVGMGDLSLETESRLWRIFLRDGMLVAGGGDAEMDKGGEPREGEGDQ